MKNKTEVEIKIEMENVSDSLIMYMDESKNPVLLDGYFSLDEVIKLGELAKELKEKI